MADAVGMDVGLVGQVHQIVDDEPPVAFEAHERAALALPFEPVVPVEIGHQRLIGERRIARPHPDETMPLDDRIGAHASRGVDRLLRRHMGAAAGRIEHKAVVAADDLVAGEPAERERQQPVPAGVLERGDGAVRAPVEDDVLVADRAGAELALDLMPPGRGVPGVEGKRFAHRHRLLRGKTSRMRRLRRRRSQDCGFRRVLAIANRHCRVPLSRRYHIQVARSPSPACWGRWRGAPDGVWAAALTPARLHKRRRELSGSRTCFPHPIRRLRRHLPHFVEKGGRAGRGWSIELIAGSTQVKPLDGGSDRRRRLG